MDDSALMFVDGKGDWLADRDSVQFVGTNAGQEFKFLVTTEALACAGDIEGHPDAQTAKALFTAHYGWLIGLAHEIWVKSNYAQQEYVLTAAQVGERLEREH